jgi:hypothetical protein
MDLEILKKNMHIEIANLVIITHQPENFSNLEKLKKTSVSIHP